MRFLGILLLLLIIYAVVKIVQTSAPPVHKVLWSLLVIAFPIVGLILWAIMGPGSPVANKK